MESYMPRTINRPSPTLFGSMAPVPLLNSLLVVARSDFSSCIVHPTSCWFYERSHNVWSQIHFGLLEASLAASSVINTSYCAFSMIIPMTLRRKSFVCFPPSLSYAEFKYFSEKRYHFHQHFQPPQFNVQQIKYHAWCTQQLGQNRRTKSHLFKLRAETGKAFLQNYFWIHNPRMLLIIGRPLRMASITKHILHVRPISAQCSQNWSYLP